MQFYPFLKYLTCSYKQEHEKVSQMQVWAKVLNILVILKYIIKAINFHSQYVCSKINLKATALLQELTLTNLLTSLTLMENTPTIYRNNISISH